MRRISLELDQDINFLLSSFEIGAMNSSRNTLAVLASIVLLLAIASASPQSKFLLI